MAGVIRAYMNEEITAFRLDDVLASIMDATQDQMVHYVGETFWFFYDDCQDHKIVASKQVWDLFHRLLLLLESDSDIVRTRRWHPLQAAAVLLVLAFLVVAVRAGFGRHLYAYALPFGLASMLIAWLNARRRRKQTPVAEAALAPFPSLTSLLAVRRRVPGFVKTRYPSALARRRIRSPITSALMWVHALVTWCMYAPVALLFQMLPDSEVQTTIRPGFDPSD